MLKLRTKIAMLVCSVVAAILLLNHYPVSMNLRQTVAQTSGSALLDLTQQFADSEELRLAIQSADRARLAQLAARLESCTNCSGLAILSEDGGLLYNSQQDGIETEFLQERKIISGARGYCLLNPDKKNAALYAKSVISDGVGGSAGIVVAKLKYSHNQEGLQKAQRELNAMTILVMLIALLFVWDLTDRIKGTLLNLEPAEIAKLLVERTALLDAVRDGILTVDESGNIVHANRRAHQMFFRGSYHRADMTEDPISDGGTAAEQHSEPAKFSDLFRDIPFENMLLRKESLFDYECRVGGDSCYVNFIPIEVDGSPQRSLLITCRPKQELLRFAEDITGVRSYVEALRAQMHEFNNKLQVVSGLVHEQQYEELKEYIDGLIHLKQREKECINGRIKDPILSAFLLSKFDRAAEQKVDLILTGRSACGRLESDALVQDIVVISGNLLENAFDATQGCAMRTVTMELIERQNDIMISVWNSGNPIDEGLIEHIFEYGVSNKADGNGIGLYLVQKACARHSGYVTVSSDPQSGTEFVAHISKDV